MLLNYLLAHLWSVLMVLASVLLTLHLLSTRRSPQSLLAWLLALVFVAPVGIPLYLMLGTRKLPRRTRAALPPGPTPATTRAAGIQRVIASAGLPPARGGHGFVLLGDGERAYDELLARIRGAARTIHLSYFILGEDETGAAVIAALAERARAGVEVRVILDAVGSRPVHRRAARELGAAGARLRTFMPLAHAPLRGRSNLRSHRKLALFDGAVLFTGGMNLALEYMGPTPRPGRWRDVAALATGPVARDAEALFASDWEFCGGRADELTILEPPPAAGDAILQFITSGPDVVQDALYDALISALFLATERVVVVTPYYVPDETLHRALLLAARRGVRTQLVMPARSNHALADFARHGLVRELRSAGVEVYGFPHGMVHAKAMLVDDRLAYVGTANFDMRSLYLNYENALFLYGAGEVAQVAEWLDALRAQCSTETFDRPRRNLWLLEQIARLLAPEL